MHEDQIASITNLVAFASSYRAIKFCVFIMQRLPTWAEAIVQVINNSTTNCRKKHLLPVYANKRMASVHERGM